MNNKKIRALLIEDNWGYVRLFDHLLQDEVIQLEIKHVPTIKMALECLEREDFDLIVSDIFLPDSQGVESLARVRAKKPQIPIIFLTSSADPKLKEEAMKHGAQDYLLKDQLVSQFIPTVCKVMALTK